MVFRKIYWVAEEVQNGASELKGVFTSVSDLHDKFVAPHSGQSLKLSLVKLDSPEGVLGTWSSPDFSGLEDDLKEYIGTGEFHQEECERLVRTLRMATAS